MDAQKYIRWLRLAFFLWPIAWLLNTLLPFLIKSFVNKILQDIEGYRGQLKGIRLHLSPARIVLHDFSFGKKIEKEEDPVILFTVKEAEIIFKWKALLKKKLVCELSLEKLHAHFFSRKENKENVKKEPKAGMKEHPSKKVSKAISKIPFPVNIKRIRITDGIMDYVDAFAEPEVRLMISNIEVQGRNISVLPVRHDRPAVIRVTGEVYGGTFALHLKAKLREIKPAFDVDMEIRDMNMVKMNSFFLAYGKFDVNKGTLSLFTEAAALNGKFKGYVKPVITDLDVLGREDWHESILHRIWEGIVDALVILLENPPKEQVASKIPFEGTFSDPEIKLWDAVIETLSNAFVVALKPSIDYEIDITTIRK